MKNKSILDMNKEYFFTSEKGLIKTKYSKLGKDLKWTERFLVDNDYESELCDNSLKINNGK